MTQVITVLTIPEEFLLLTVADDEGGFVDMTPEAAAAGFIGAAIMELALRNRIDSDLERVWVHDKTPVGEACVDVVLERLGSDDFELDAERLIEQLLTQGELVRAHALERVCERGILHETEGKFLWFRRARRYPVVNGQEIREVKLRLLDVLLQGGIPDPRDICLMSLADSCGLFSHIIPAESLTTLEARFAALARMELIGLNVSRYIQIFRATLPHRFMTWC